MNLQTYFSDRGIDVISSSFYSKIREWEQWYEGYTQKFHRYYIYNGDERIYCRRLSLGMAKKLCEDIADLLMNEKVKVTITGTDATVAYVEKALKDNNFMTMCNQYQERKAYSGTVAYIPHLKNIVINEDGEIIRAGGVNINYIQAKNIFPISWENGRVIEAAFVFPKTVNRKRYALIQLHRLTDKVSGGKEYIIENDVVRCTKGAGTRIPPERWNELKPFEGLSQIIRTGSDKPQFVIDTLNIVNNADEDDTNPMGIAIFANALDILQKIDIEYDSYCNEFALGRKRIFVAPELINNLNGEKIFDSNDTVFYQLPEGALDGGKPITEVNMDIRADAHSKAINDDLNLLSFRVGFGTQRYKFEKGTMTTATQVISENSDMYRTIKKHELVLESVIKELICIIAHLGMISKETNVNDDIEIAIDFDDSIIEDKSTERAQDRQDVSMGAMSLTEYRAKWYGETQEEAEKNLPEQTGLLDNLNLR